MTVAVCGSHKDIYRNDPVIHFHWETTHLHLCPLWTDLWDDGDPGAELMEAQLSNVHPVNEDMALGSLDDPEQTQRQGGLPCSSAPHDPHLMET